MRTFSCALCRLYEEQLEVCSCSVVASVEIDFNRVFLGGRSWRVAFCWRECFADR